MDEKRTRHFAREQQSKRQQEDLISSCLLSRNNDGKANKPDRETDKCMLYCDDKRQENTLEWYFKHGFN